LLYQTAGDLAELLRLARRGNHEIDRKVSAAGKRRWSKGNDSNAGNFRQRSHRLDEELLRGLGSLTPRLGDHAAKTTGWKRELKDALALGDRSIHVVDLRREQLGLIDRRVRGRLDDAKHDPLILGRGELALR